LKQGDFKMRKLLIFFALVSMTLSITAVAHAGHAANVFPYANGYTANYTATQGTSTWDCAIQFTGTATLPGGSVAPSYLWAIMQQTNWDNDGNDESSYVRTTYNTLYQYDSKQPGITPAYSIPLFEIPSKGSSSWTYTDTNGNVVTATVVSIGPLTVPASTHPYQGVYQIHYSSTQQDETMYWAPGVGLLKDVDNSPSLSAPITRLLTSTPFADILIGTWNGNMDIVTPGNTAVEKGTVQVVFDQVTNTTQAYTGTLTWTPATGSAGSTFTLTFSVIRGPFDATLLHITAPNNVILGEMRRQADYWVVDLHGSDISAGNTYVSLGLSKK
jgi:hypothetical protein